MPTNNPTDLDNREASDAWAACAPGELQGLATRVQGAERRRQTVSLVKLAASTMATTAGLVLAIGLLVGDGNQQDFGGLTCKECSTNFESYFAHLTNGAELEVPAPQQMAEHLRGCKWCRKSFEFKHPGVLRQFDIVAGRQPLFEVATRFEVATSLSYAAAYQ